MRHQAGSGCEAENLAHGRQVLVNLMLISSTSPLRRLATRHLKELKAAAEADILTRVEDLAFVLCWADQGSVMELNEAFEIF